MTITRTRRQAVEDPIRKGMAAIPTSRKDFREDLEKLAVLIQTQCEDRGFRVILTEDEIEDLLLPWLRMLCREQPMAAVISVGGEVSVSALNRLSAVGRNTARCAVLPSHGVGEDITIFLLPVSPALRDLLALDGLATCVFPNRRGPRRT